MARHSLLEGLRLRAEREGAIEDLHRYMWGEIEKPCKLCRNKAGCIELLLERTDGQSHCKRFRWRGKSWLSAAKDDDERAALIKELHEVGELGEAVRDVGDYYTPIDLKPRVEAGEPPNSELKPCPFCGGEAIMDYIEAHTHWEQLAKIMPDYEGGHFIECTGCTCVLSSGNDRNDAIAAWNRRIDEGQDL